MFFGWGQLLVLQHAERGAGVVAGDDDSEVILDGLVRLFLGVDAGVLQRDGHVVRLGFFEAVGDGHGAPGGEKHQREQRNAHPDTHCRGRTRVGAVP